MKTLALVMTVVLGLLAACAQVTQTSQPAVTQTIITNIPSPVSTLTPTSEATPSGTWIKLSPDSGSPGATVQVNGYLPGGLPADELTQNNYLTYADLCWDGCQDGLMISGLEVSWSEQDMGHFRLQFVVPSIPWLAADGVHPLKPGDYPVELIYLDPNAPACIPTADASQECQVKPQASATFHLTSGYNGSECQEGASCGFLKAIPEKGAAGDIIQVEGWAPLLQIIGQPFGYDLVLVTPGGSASNSIYLASRQQDVVQQEMNGSLKASFQVPQYGNDGVALRPGGYTLALQAMLSYPAEGKNITPTLVAPIQFDITPAPEWTERQRTAPLWIQPSANLSDPVVSVDMGNPNRLAYCNSGAISYSQDGGKSWSSIPTSPVKDLVLDGDLVINEDQPTCISVLMDSAHPESYYAVFGAVSQQWGAPPIYYIGYFTLDSGKTWQVVPIPAIQITGSLAVGLFGGFWTDGNVVQALYLNQTSEANIPGSLSIKQTEDGGKTWKAASLNCPNRGPCLRWGAAPGEISGMGAGLPQEVLASLDSGQTWNSTDQSVELRGEGPHELVALSATEALILSGNERYPVRYTPDGGKTWQVLALPALPGSSTSWTFGYSGLQMLPDGSLLAMNPDTGMWWALPPNGQEWCALDIEAPGKYPVLLQPSGDRVWWISSVSATIESAPLSSFSCSP